MNAGNRREYKQKKNEKKKVYKIKFSFFLKLKKKKRNYICHKTLIFVLSSEKQKSSLPGSHVKS